MARTIPILKTGKKLPCPVVPCERCSQTGINALSKSPCPTCNGTGWIHFRKMIARP